MRGIVPVALFVAGGFSVVAAQTSRPAAVPGPAEQPIRPVRPLVSNSPARPAILVLRVWEPDAGARGFIEVLEPPGIRHLPYDLRNVHDAPRSGDTPRDDDDFNPDGTPRLGPTYALARTCVPESARGSVRYYIYHIDLSDPQVAENWRALQRAERQAQREERAERRGRWEWERRKQRLLDAHALATEEGVVLMQAGAYRAAVIALTRAAALNQGDPVCRVYLALARVGLGHDLEAAQVLRRALELQPKLVPMRLDLAQYYPSAEEFAAQVEALRRRVRSKSPATADEYFLLGFMEFQSGGYEQAYAAFCQAARGLGKDKRLRTYLELTRPATP